MSARLPSSHDPSNSPALHFKEYILSSRRSARSTRSRAKRHHAGGADDDDLDRSHVAAAATPAGVAGGAGAWAQRPRAAFPRSNQYFEARCDDLAGAVPPSPLALSPAGAAAAAATGTADVPGGRALRGDGGRVHRGDRAARRGVLRLATWRGHRQHRDDQLTVAVESVMSQRELGRFTYTPPRDPSENGFTHALCQPSTSSAASSSSLAADGRRAFAVAYVSNDDADQDALQFYVRAGGRTLRTSAGAGRGGHELALPKVAWKWRRREDVRVFALEPLSARGRQYHRQYGGDGGDGDALTFAFLACEHDQLWYIQLDVDDDGAGLSAVDSVRLQLPKADLPADRRWQSRCSFGLYATLMGPPLARSVAVAAACSDEHSLYVLVHFDREVRRPLAAGEAVEVLEDDKDVWRTAVVDGRVDATSYRVRLGGGGDAAAAVVVVPAERIHPQNFTCYQFLRRTGKVMPEPRLRVASRTEGRHGGGGGPAMHMELASMVPSITRGDIFALFLTFVGATTDGRSLCRVRKLVVVGGGGGGSSAVDGGGGGAGTGGGDDAAAVAPTGGGVDGYVREFELEEAVDVVATAAVESEAVVVWTDEPARERLMPSSGPGQGQQRVLYVTRADFPYDGVLPADNLPDEHGNPGGFVNALALPCGGGLVGEVVVDAAEDTLLLRCLHNGLGGGRPSGGDDSGGGGAALRTPAGRGRVGSGGAGGDGGGATLLVRLGLASRRRHRELMALMAPPSYYVTRAEFQNYVFDQVLGSENHPERHMEQILLKYNQLRLLGEYQFAGKSHAGPEYLEKVIERVKFAHDVCQSLQAALDPPLPVPENDDGRRVDFLGWTGVGAVLGEMAVRSGVRVVLQELGGGGGDGGGGGLDEFTERELEFMDRGVAVLRSHAFGLPSHRPRSSRDASGDGSGGGGSGGGVGGGGAWGGDVAVRDTGADDLRHQGVGGRRTGITAVRKEAVGAVEEADVRSDPSLVVVDAAQLCARYVLCLVDNRLTDRDCWCRALDAADLLVRLLAREQRAGSNGHGGGGSGGGSSTTAPGPRPYDPPHLRFKFFRDFMVLLNKLYFGLRTMDHRGEEEEEEDDDDDDDEQEEVVEEENDDDEVVHQYQGQSQLQEQDQLDVAAAATTPLRQAAFGGRRRRRRRGRASASLAGGVSLLRFEQLVRECVRRGFGPPAAPGARAGDDGAATAAAVSAEIREALAKTEGAAAAEAEAVAVSPLQLLIKIAPFTTVMGACAHDERLVQRALKKYLEAPPVLTPAKFLAQAASADFVVYYHACEVGTEGAQPAFDSLGYALQRGDDREEEDKWRFVQQFSGGASDGGGGGGDGGGGDGNAAGGRVPWPSP